MKRTYPVYKDSGVKWLGMIPHHWTEKRLKNMASIRVSNVDKKTVEGQVSIRLCNYVDVYYNDRITQDIEFMEATATSQQIEKFALREGDVLITKDSETPDDIAVPSLVVSNLDGVICGYHLALIRPNRSTMVGPYLSRALSAVGIRDQFHNSATGVTRFGLAVNEITDANILVPPIEEQRSIASFLDRKTTEIDALIAKKRRMIELLQEKRTAVISHAVTKGLDPNAPMKDSGVEWLGKVPRHWKLLPLKHIGNIVLGKMLTNEDKGGSFLKPYLRAQNITWEKVDTNDVREMWFSVQELNQLRLTKNDLLISEGGEVGRAAIWNNELPECYIQNAVHKVTLKSCHNPLYYLYHSLIYGKGGYFDAIVNRVSIAHLTREKLKDVCFLAPPKEEQNRIISHIINEAAKIDLLIAKINDAIDKLLEYRTALISAAVTGKIDVRNEVRA